MRFICVVADIMKFQCRILESISLDFQLKIKCYKINDVATECNHSDDNNFFFSHFKVMPIKCFNHLQTIYI